MFWGESLEGLSYSKPLSYVWSTICVRARRMLGCTTKNPESREAYYTNISGQAIRFWKNEAGLGLFSMSLTTFVQGDVLSKDLQWIKMLTQVDLVPPCEHIDVMAMERSRRCQVVCPEHIFVILTEHLVVKFTKVVTMLVICVQEYSWQQK